MMLCSLGTQEIYPHNYFISKINPSGELLWSTRPAPHIETALVVIPNCLAFQETSAFLAGYSGKLGYIVVSSFHSESGRLQWENKEIVSSNSHMFTTHLISDGTSLYLLGFSGFSKIKPYVAEYQDSNDFILNINATNGDIIWSQTLTLSSQRELSLHPFTSVFTYLSLSEQEQEGEGGPLLYVSGNYHDYTTGGSSPIAQLLFPSNGSMYRDISETATTHDDKILYTKSSFNRDSYSTESAENVHYYGTNRDTLGSYILKNSCPDGYFLEATSETTSVGSHCPGITWSIQPTEDHFLTCSYIYGGVETAGLVVIYLLPFLFSLICSYHSQISILSTCLTLFATLSFSSDISYLTSQVFYNLFSFGITFLSFSLPILPYAAYMRTHTRGRTHRKYLTPDDPSALSSNFSRFISMLIYIRHLFFYFYLYCLGYILFLLCLLPHPPLRETLLSYLLTEETADPEEDSTAVAAVSSKTLTSSLLFTSVSLVLFSFLPTLVFQSLNDHLMSFTDPDIIISVISIVCKSLFMLTLVNYIFYSYGMATFSVLWSHIQTITTLSASTLLTFQEIDEQDEGSGGGAAIRAESRQGSAALQKNEIEMYQKRIRDLEIQLEQATGRTKTVVPRGESEDSY